jgi:hypothetical protein
MKNISLAFFTIFVMTACAIDQSIVPVQKEQPGLDINKKYRNDLRKCDAVAKQKLNSPEYLTTIGMNKAVAEQIDCYKNIAHQIIDQDYKQNADDMKDNLADYIEVSARMVGYINRPDSCYPYCGTIVSIASANASLEHTKKYLDMLINGDTSWGEQ